MDTEDLIHLYLATYMHQNLILVTSRAPRFPINQLTNQMIRYIFFC